MIATESTAKLFQAGRPFLPLPKRVIEIARPNAYETTLPSAAPIPPNSGRGTSTSEIAVLSKVVAESDTSAHPIFPEASRAVFVSVRRGRSIAAEESAASDDAPIAD